MSKEIDVLIIGSGVAGAMAYSRAQERGAKALWISKSIGATGLSSGAINWPQFNADPSDKRTLAWKLFLQQVHVLDFKSTERAFTQIGSVKKCFAVQGSQFFDFDAHHKEDLIAVVGFSGLPQFDAQATAHMLEYNGFRAQPLLIEFEPQNQERWQSLASFAQDFDQASTQEACLPRVVHALQSKAMPFKHLLFPAALGFHSAGAFLQKLEKQISHSASELLGYSHSIPGIRLGRALSEHCKQDRVINYKQNGHHIDTTQLKNHGAVQTKSIILATGRFLAGGFHKKSQAFETIFKLPITQKVLEAWLETDEQQRPLNQFGEVFATNLFAAGANIEKGAPSLGQAILTGYQAGDLC
ncbi:MAG: FAD-binding protein [Deltaproteobacteria bacterium]|nr:FAD-binding protein [Deltaproteobacteria bacterium]